MIWYLSDLARFRHEREAIEALASSSDGLITILAMRFEGIRLIFDVDISCPAGLRSVSLRYPNEFPDLPLSVFPRNREHWSQHQYGRGGELCLEYGPDNWHPDITGAMMIESAQRLFQTEAPVDGQRGVVASRHATTLGQDLRSRYLRLLVTQSLEGCVTAVPVGPPLPATCVWTSGQKSVVLILTSITFAEASEWTDASVPGELKRQMIESGALVCRVPADQALPAATVTREFLSVLGAPAPEQVVLPLLVVVIRDRSIHGYCLWKDGTLDKLALVQSPDSNARLDPEHVLLATHKVAVVGCGSVGSKIATSLARSGVGSFLLVDDDIFLPENLVRNDLDWRDAGAHKAHALAARLELVNSAVRCEVSTHRLGGQEASGGVETLVETLARCDLIIDATADPHVFGYLCAAAKSGSKPMIWAEVFGGGYGGLIARSRPTLDPDPASARAIIEAWCREQGLPIERARDYAGGTAQRPLIADDADVTVIAAHAARFAIDTLIVREPSTFPQSAYMVGLAKGWLFQQPFETYPIDLGSARAPADLPAPLNPQVAQEERDRILRMFATQLDETADSSGAS